MSKFATYFINKFLDGDDYTWTLEGGLTGYDIIPKRITNINMVLHGTL